MAKLFIICGQGVGDPEACGNGYQEAERVRTLAKRLNDAPFSEGYSTIMCHPCDNHVSVPLFL